MATPTKHGFDFDPSYGYGLERLRAVKPPPAPPGFDLFWERRYRRARAVVPAPTLARSAIRHPDWHIEDIAFASTGGFTIRGWLMVPKRGPVKRGLVVGHGYGGREAPDLALPVTETAMLFPCFRGLSLSARPPISSNPAWHVLHNIDDPEKYVIGGCVEDVWVSVSVLAELLPETAGAIGYSGISFGGGIGALAIPFDPRIDRGFLEVPTFGNRPLWVTLPTTGSAASVQVYRRNHPEIDETLRFFDAAIAATRITVPMLVAVACFDPAVAPPCQFSVANAVPKANCDEIFILDAGHFDYPEAAAQHDLLNRAVRRFFGTT